MYVIHVTATAKADNPNFAGKINHYYYGKHESDLNWYVKNDIAPREYVFKTFAAACRAKKVHEHEERYWTNEVEVLTWEEAVATYEWEEAIATRKKGD